MNFTRVTAVVLRHYYLSVHQLERIFDTFFFPIFALLLWGFFSKYAQGLQVSSLTGFLLGGLILWVIFERVGTDIGINFMFDIWERNIINILATPLTFLEYLTGLVIVSFTKILFSFVAMWALASLVYQFDITGLGFNLAFFSVNLVIFAISLGIFNISLVLRFGHSIGPLTWILPFLLQPLSAVFYPISVLPNFLQKVAFIIPISHVFQGMRYSLNGLGFNYQEFYLAVGINIVYFILAVSFFAFIFQKAKKSGKLVKLM